MARILHLYGGMPAGGVRSTLFNTLRFQPYGVHDQTLLDLKYKGPIALPNDADLISYEHVSVACGLNPTIEQITDCVKKEIDENTPDLVQCWGDFANYVGLRSSLQNDNFPYLVCRMSSSRSFEEAKKPGSPVPEAILRETAFLASNADFAIYTSAEVSDIHTSMGFKPQDNETVYNGVCCRTFSPEVDERKLNALKAEIGIPEASIIIGHSGRYNPMAKNQPGFLKAAFEFCKSHPDAVFVMCGDGVDHTNAELQSEIQALGLKDQVFTLGKRDDMPVVYHLAEVWSSTSRTEAFPNVVLEAMASGKVVTATETGMPELTVGDPKLIIPTSKTMPVEQDWITKQAEVWRALAEMSGTERAAIGERNREVICNSFNIRGQIDRFYEIYEKLLREEPSRSIPVGVSPELIMNKT